MQQPLPYKVHFQQTAQTRSLHLDQIIHFFQIAVKKYTDVLIASGKVAMHKATKRNTVRQAMVDHGILSQEDDEGINTSDEEERYEIDKSEESEESYEPPGPRHPLFAKAVEEYTDILIHKGKLPRNKRITDRDVRLQAIADQTLWPNAVKPNHCSCADIYSMWFFIM